MDGGATVAVVRQCAAELAPGGTSGSSGASSSKASSDTASGGNGDEAASMEGGMAAEGPATEAGGCSAAAAAEGGLGAVVVAVVGADGLLVEMTSEGRVLLGPATDSEPRSGGKVRPTSSHLLLNMAPAVVCIRLRTQGNR